MERLLDWYWQEGRQRPEAWTWAPEGVGQVMEATAQLGRIARLRTAGGRGCVAFWGPSQAGKSSLLSHYLDSEDAQGGALVWQPGERVRFSAAQQAADAGGVVFNPFRGGMDASAVVTRFYLPERSEEVPRERPVELLLSTRKQVLHALALGYHLECAPSIEAWNAGELQRLLAEKSRGASREAFELLFEACSVCEALAQELPAYASFREEYKVRAQVLSSRFVDDLAAAWELTARLLWDGHPRLTELVNALEGMRQEVAALDSGRGGRLFASLRVAALLEDIGALEGASGAQHWKREALERLQVAPCAGGVCFCLEGEAAAMPGRRQMRAEAFGLLQALVGEMRLPVRRTGNPAAKPFFDFLERLDLLDIPGVTNKAVGFAQGAENLLDLDLLPARSPLLLTRVFKSGKTLAVVHAQAETCAIDGMVVFIDLEQAGGLARPGTIDHGVQAWLRPFGAGAGASSQLRLYLNCSLFGKLQDKVNAAVQTGSLQDYCRKAEALAFVRAGYAQVLFTSSCFVPWRQPALQRVLVRDEAFRACFLQGAAGDSLSALMADGLGTDYLFTRLAGEVTPQTRLALYTEMARACRERLRALVAQLLPRSAGEQALRCQEAVRKVLAQLQGLDLEAAAEVRRLSAFVKAVFQVDPAQLEALPANPNRLEAGEVRAYLRRQCAAWVNRRKTALAGDEAVAWLVDEAQLPLFLQALATLDFAQWTDWIRACFWNLPPEASRAFIAMALVNGFLWGSHARQRSEPALGGPYAMLCAPFVARLKQLVQCTPVLEDGRPANLQGDASLGALAAELALV